MQCYDVLTIGGLSFTYILILRFKGRQRDLGKGRQKVVSREAQKMLGVRLPLIFLPTLMSNFF